MVIDIILVITLLALCLFGELSALSHEILGIVFSAAFLAHLIMNRRTLFRGSSTSAKRNVVLTINLLTGVSIIVCVVSGLLISELFPALNVGLLWMHKLHYYSFIATAAFTGLHLILHFAWIRAVSAKTWQQKRSVTVAAVLCAVVLTAGCLAAGSALTSRLYSTTSSGTIADEGETVSTNTASDTVTTTTDTTTTVFTAETLAQYDGQNGNAAYIAVDGVVYDVSSVFRNGRHHGYSAGQDLTDAFNREHSSRELQGLTVVGTYQD